MGCLALELAGSWVAFGLSVGMEDFGLAVVYVNIPWVRSSVIIQSSGVETPVSEFQSKPLTVPSRLLHPHNTEDKTPRLMVKQLFIARNA